MKSSRPIDKLFQEAGGELANLITRTSQLRRLTGQLRRCVDDPVASHCYVGSINNKTLTVLVDSASWATKFRFISPALLPRLREEYPVFSELEQINVRVLTTQKEPENHSTTHRPSMNQENARGIKNLADSIEDPALQEALQKLASHAKTR